MAMVQVPRKRIMLARLSPLYDALRHPGLFRSVDRFCMFVGHGRSGSTLIGALLNAHPDVVLSNELDVFSYLEVISNRRQLFGLIYHMSQRQARHGSPGGGGYYYAVPNQWQGTHRQIRVIGDRRAGATAIKLFNEPELLRRLEDLVRLPVTFVSVLRNPFDTIATTVTKTHRLEGEAAESHLRRQIEHYFERCEGILRVQERLGDGSVQFVYHEEFVADPRRVLSDLCHALGLEPIDSYLADCAGVVRRDPHITRRTIDWSPESIRLVDKRIREIPWLAGYAF